MTKLNPNASLLNNSLGASIKLANISISSSSLGLQESTVYQTELQDLKTDTQTFKAQAETTHTHTSFIISKEK